ncbi:Gfo/Idh/MocA family oxidoreductase [Haematospirillum jordaniae]|uniref:Gfo/Idh/MocA family oxidoreductase n=1 Tax=Haematospirillum jordaniae TaxID=1549855 RepID=UPI0014334078|nr:Gfo/Idh/MocA family oxidoreductase [Haematospirillum jordaniae]NKD86340.1 Gfo/Idh/MocA family oxidoreductase [Haematospirillum jordaniae]
MSRPLRTLVCGTRFGETYLSALLEEDAGFVLSGILARGSERSQALSRDLGVPLYTSTDEVPDTIDIACVVLRSTAFGGPGTRVAESLLRRGIHVLQEHPVHPSDLSRLDDAATAGRACWHVNTFYPHSQAARRFIDCLQAWRQVRDPDYITLTTSPQFLCSALDILGRAFGGLGCFRVLDCPPWPADFCRDYKAPPPFNVIRAVIGSVPVIMNLQGWVDPRDLDHHAMVMHNIAAGSREARVELVNSFGPVVWSHSLYVPDYVRDDASASVLGNWTNKKDQRHFSCPTALVLGDPQGASLIDAMRDVFPGIILSALSELRDAIERAQQQRLLADAAALGHAWQACLQAMGPLREVSLDPPPPPIPDPFLYVDEGRRIPEVTL